MYTTSSLTPELQRHTKLISVGTSMYLAEWQGTNLVVKVQEAGDESEAVIYDDNVYPADNEIVEIVDIDIDETETDITCVVRKAITVQTNADPLKPQFKTVTSYEILVEEGLLGSSVSGSL